jgi:hypothetical protein
LNGERNYFAVRTPRKELPCYIYAIKPGHGQIKQYNRRLKLRSHLKRCPTVKRLADYFNVGIAFQQSSDASEHNRMIVDNENAKRGWRSQSGTRT